MRKFLITMMCIIMVVCFMPTVAMADSTTGCTGDEGCRHEAIIVDDNTNTHYDTLQEAINAASSGSTIKLLNDVNCSSVIEITKSISIDGDGHNINTTANRGIWIDASDLDVSLNNFKLIAEPGTERGVQVNVGITGINLNINSCEINSTYYGINVCNNAGVELTITNSKVSAWGALNLWSAEYSVTANDSIFIGNNDKSYDEEGWNGFGTVVLEGDTTGQTDNHAELNTVTLNNCKIIAETQNGNAQCAFLFNAQSKNNKVYVNGINTEVSVPGTERLCTDNGTGNKLIISDGSFSQDPKDYLVDGKFSSKETTAENALYIVHEHSTCNFGHTYCPATCEGEGICHTLSHYVPPYIPPTTPTDNVTNSGTSGTDNATTSADLSGSTSTSNGTTTSTVDKTTADKIVDKAVENKSEEIVIDATANSTTVANSTTTAQVTIPTETLGAIAEKTEADVTIKTDVAEVKLD
ncbi:MAG: hypothetical protein ACI4LZ_00235, partial [Anaerovoracaceae bacterium]